MPPTIIVDRGGEVGSVQMFVGDGEHGAGGAVSDEEAMKAAVFDFLVFNTDRHDANYLTDGKGHLVLIDNGLILPTEERYLRDRFTPRWRTDVPRGVMDALNGGDWAGLYNRLISMGVEREAVDSMSQRVAYLRAEGAVDRNEWDSTPWRTFPSFSESSPGARHGSLSNPA